jgi:uncharacterized repeat protein (TIGR01451 family)
MAFLGVAWPAAAELCVFPDILEDCNADDEPDCALDFETDNADDDGVASDVILDQRRARARAEGGVANTRRALADVGIRFRLATDLSNTSLRVQGHYDGLIRGGVGEAFGNFEVSVVLRDLDAGDVLIDKRLDGDSQEGGAGRIVSGNVEDEILQDLSKEKNYALSLQIRAAARGFDLGRSDFETGARGLFLDAVSIAGVNHSDPDGDGLPSEWETEGVRDCDGNMLLNLPALGADPAHKDLFVELDWVNGSPPRKHAVAAVKSAFLEAPEDAGGQDNPDGERGVRLHIDTGQLIDELLPEDSGDTIGTCGDELENGDGDGSDADDPDCRIGDDLGGGTPIALANLPNGNSVPGLAGDTDGNGTPDFFELKQQFFAENRKYAFRYAIVTPTTQINCPADPLDVPDDSAECFTLGGFAKGVNFVVTSDSPGTLMHEIGHTLGLGHGGPKFTGTVVLDPQTGEPIVPDQADINCKPNYISVMNYALDGLKQVSHGGQDLDGDGALDGEIIDYSPPRFLVFDASGGVEVRRSLAPLASLDESCLDETQVLDPFDPQNMIAFTDATDVDQESPVNAPVNWDGDDTTENQCVVANVNLAFSQRCREDPEQNAMAEGQGLAGAHDWDAIVLNPRKRGDGFAIELEENEPTLAEMEAIRRKRDRADLAISKEVAPTPAVAGQPVTLTISLRNGGPNHVTAAEIVDQVPSEIEVLSLDSGCREMPESTVTCRLGNFHAGDEREFAIRGRLRADLDCDGRQFLRLINSAQVTNVRGHDPNPANNSVRTPFEVLCIRYEYPAKAVCGRQLDGDRIHLLAGRYATTVNVHNPNDEEVRFFAKLAAAKSPALEPAAGPTSELGLYSLRYDESLAIDCEHVSARIFDGELPGGLIDGHIVLQSSRQLDVHAVYTATGSASGNERNGSLDSIDVERVQERDRRNLGQRLPDLIPSAVRCLTPGAGQGNFPVQAEIEIENKGAGDADAFTSGIHFGDVSVETLMQPHLQAGSRVNQTISIPTECRPDCRLKVVVDSEGLIDETDEHNNVATTTCVPLPG